MVAALLDQRTHDDPVVGSGMKLGTGQNLESRTTRQTSRPKHAKNSVGLSMPRLHLDHQSEPQRPHALELDTMIDTAPSKAHQPQKWKTRIASREPILNPDQVFGLVTTLVQMSSSELYFVMERSW
jgi:hypothetical protein